MGATLGSARGRVGPRVHPPPICVGRAVAPGRKQPHIDGCSWARSRSPSICSSDRACLSNVDCSSQCEYSMDCRSMSHASLAIGSMDRRCKRRRFVGITRDITRGDCGYVSHHVPTTRLPRPKRRSSYGALRIKLGAQIQGRAASAENATLLQKARALQRRNGAGERTNAPRARWPHA